MGWKLCDWLRISKRVRVGTEDADLFPKETDMGKDKAGAETGGDNHSTSNTVMKEPCVVLYSKSAKRVFVGRNTQPIIPGFYRYAKNVRKLQQRRKGDSEARLQLGDVDRQLKQLEWTLEEKERALAALLKDNDAFWTHIDREHGMAYPLSVGTRQAWMLVDILERYDRMISRLEACLESNVIDKKTLREYTEMEREFRRLFAVSR